MFQYSFPTGRMQFYLGLVLVSGAGLGGFRQPFFISLSTSSHSLTHLLFCNEQLMFPGNSVQTQQAGSPKASPFQRTRGLSPSCMEILEPLVHAPISCRRLSAFPQVLFSDVPKSIMQALHSVDLQWIFAPGPAAGVANYAQSQSRKLTYLEIGISCMYSLGRARS